MTANYARLPGSPLWERRERRERGRQFIWPFTYFIRDSERGQTYNAWFECHADFNVSRSSFYLLNLSHKTGTLMSLEQSMNSILLLLLNLIALYFEATWILCSKYSSWPHEARSFYQIWEWVHGLPHSHCTAPLPPSLDGGVHLYTSDLGTTFKN